MECRFSFAELRIQKVFLLQGRFARIVDFASDWVWWFDNNS